jgi:hypothetical protein
MGNKRKRSPTQNKKGFVVEKTAKTTSMMVGVGGKHARQPQEDTRQRGSGTSMRFDLVAPEMILRFGFVVPNHFNFPKFESSRFHDVLGRAARALDTSFSRDTFLLFAVLLQKVNT